MAAPIRAVHHIFDVNNFITSPKRNAIGDMLLIAFFFLLRVGEHTGHRAGQNKQTKQLRAMDVTFWDEQMSVITHGSPLEQLKGAASITMRIDNQKNGARGGTTHQNVLHTKHCPIRALAQRVHAIVTHPNGKPSDVISTHHLKNGIAKALQARDINNAIKEAAMVTGLGKSRFSRKSVSSHSLRAGGAMAMHLNGINRDTIQKIGWWSSDTFLMHIHEQISAVSNGVSKRVATEIGWHNIEGPSFDGPVFTDGNVTAAVA